MFSWPFCFTFILVYQWFFWYLKKYFKITLCSDVDLFFQNKTFIKLIFVYKTSNCNHFFDALGNVPLYHQVPRRNFYNCYDNIIKFPLINFPLDLLLNLHWIYSIFVVYWLKHTVNNKYVDSCRYITECGLCVAFDILITRTCIRVTSVLREFFAFVILLYLFKIRLFVN